jgi:DNA-binding ferritin-like protein
MMNDYIAMLMQSRTQTHVYHLQTTSYAKHIALNEYYNQIVELIDGISESYQGKYGILSEFQIDASIKNLKNDRDVIDYFEKLRRYCELMREKLPQDRFLVHQYDDVDTLINTTVYKLKFLS